MQGKKNKQMDESRPKSILPRSEDYSGLHIGRCSSEK
jgi:hypothetical protein